MANWPSAHAWMPKAYSLLWTVLLTAIPVSVMTVLYSRVILTLWVKPSQATGNDPSDQVGKGDWRIPNNDFFLLRQAKQQQRLELLKFAYLTMRNSRFARFAEAYFSFALFRNPLRCFHDLK